ncbi:MAG: SIS domain-containing protein [bacterium]|nr:SIS domain-containing protein [bacterium]
MPQTTYHDHCAHFADQLRPRPNCVIGKRPASRTGRRRIDRPDVVIIAGMGGSGFAGDLLRHFSESLALPVPVIVWKNPGLPRLRFSRPLVVAVSHSGNTRETLDAFRTAGRRGYRRGAAATGGRLLAAATVAGVPRARIPTLPRLTPREGVGYTYFALIELLRTWFPNLRNPAFSHLMRFESLERQAKQIARELGRNDVSLFVSSNLTAVGYLWKLTLSETAKRHATLEILPEAAHNTIMGFVRPVYRTCAIFLAPWGTPDRTGAVVRKLIARQGTPTIPVTLRGSSLKEHTWNGILLGHLVALALAKREKLDPSATALTDEVKRLVGR